MLLMSTVLWLDLEKTAEATGGVVVRDSDGDVTELRWPTGAWSVLMTRLSDFMTGHPMNFEPRPWESQDPPRAGVYTWGGYRVVVMSSESFDEWRLLERLADEAYGAVTDSILRTAPEGRDKAAWVQHAPGEVRPDLEPLPVEWAGKPATDDEFKLEQLPDDSLRMECTIAGRRAIHFSVDFGRNWTEGRLPEAGFTLDGQPLPPLLSAYHPSEEEGLEDVLSTLSLVFVHGDTLDTLVVAGASGKLYEGAPADIWAWLRQSGRIA